MKGFGIEIKNNLLEKKHVAGMGQAVWLYMWLIDKMTSIDEEGIGKVLGGKPVKYEDVEAELGISQDTYTRWIDKLVKHPYIEAIRTPYGISYRVYKAYKHFGKRVRKNAESNSAETRNLLRENAESNKTGPVTETVDTPATSAGRIEEKFDLKTEITKLEESSRRDLNIIALYFDEKKPDIRNRAQYQVAIKRHLRPAKLLSPFTDDQILRAARKAGEKYPEWTIETLVKLVTK